MVRIFFLPNLGNRSKSDPCLYELFCLESHILSFPKVLQIPPESPCILHYDQTPLHTTYVTNIKYIDTGKTKKKFLLLYSTPHSYKVSLYCQQSCYTAVSSYIKTSLQNLMSSNMSCSHIYLYLFISKEDVLF